MPPQASDYRGGRFALLTQHGKQVVLAPIVADGLGASLELVTGVDTDALGTFTREVPRPGTQLDAARTKARLAIQHSGLACGLASEGAFQPGPFGIGAHDVELVLFLDAEHGLEITGRAIGRGVQYHGTVTTWSDLEQLAARAQFPSHGLVLRPDDEHASPVVKGITDAGTLRTIFDQLRARSVTGAVFVENDLRAHMSPTRMQVIGAAARDLVARLHSPCPACATPGFAVVERIAGLPCGDCGEPTQLPRAERLGCIACDHQDVRALAGPAAADPGRCDVCNP